jgi:hypothetical protein
LIVRSVVENVSKIIRGEGRRREGEEGSRRRGVGEGGRERRERGERGRGGLTGFLGSLYACGLVNFVDHG